MGRHEHLIDKWRNFGENVGCSAIMVGIGVMLLCIGVCVKGCELNVKINGWMEGDTDEFHADPHVRPIIHDRSVRDAEGEGGAVPQNVVGRDEAKQ